MIKILVIFTGGTIGSSVQGDYIQTDTNKNHGILDAYKGDYIEFTAIEPYTILSENLNGTYINTLAKCIKENAETFDGIIITHGTDTLQYTSAGLALTTDSIKLPVVLVSSNYVLMDKRANGALNFDSAVRYISYVKGIDDEPCREKYYGVHVAYANGMGNALIHHGAMLLPHTAYDDKIFSVDDMTAGEVIDKAFLPNKSYDVYDIKSRIQKAVRIIADGGAFSLDTKYPAYSNVLWIKEYPGKMYENPSDNTKAVLLEGYHSGTFCADNEYLRRFLAYCNRHDISVFAVGMEDRIPYESTKFMDACNIKILPKISPVLAYMMLWKAVS